MLSWDSISGKVEAGCDEAGRGALAGPVVAAAVILRKDSIVQDLIDSKVLSPVKREEMRIWVEREAMAFACASVDSLMIDEINILNASILAMHMAISKLNVQPKFLLIDGNQFSPYPKIPHQCIIKGDSSHACIAAASVIAKTHRDKLMVMLHELYPEYNWKSNKGYASAQHIEAIRRYGLSEYHRKSFQLKGQLKLQF